jgi:hypothetical protein
MTLMSPLEQGMRGKLDNKAEPEGSIGRGLGAAYFQDDSCPYNMKRMHQIEQQCLWGQSPVIGSTVDLPCAPFCEGHQTSIIPQGSRRNWGLSSFYSPHATRVL